MQFEAVSQFSPEEKEVNRVLLESLILKHDANRFTLSQAERYDRAGSQAINLAGKWLTEAGFSEGMPLKIRVMPDCIVITAQNTSELWGCLDGLRTEPFDADAANEWLNAYPDGLVATE